ncbi:FdhF/YdeP family oxidoreductase [Pseudoduganella albidiflava]|uniref:FdhF/YdeP family oxidoreductase n=1 Tax=Pseudoduganella albidiflava TaxID=321983 RepID=A0ABX5S4C8_9BURK|nr:FdhF/YdeP family oxidoreductase [Pseudoduganella albidiflava]QBI05081.1 FdhF/YdeP family oxidoreductase [Pseudoduganella albidiflava]
MTQQRIEPYNKPAGGFGSLHGTAKALIGNPGAQALATLPRLNQPRGVDCPGCAYPDSPDSKSVDFCEQGAWAIAHESGKARATPSFFAANTVTALRTLEHVELEAAGRLTAPLLYDAASDTYREIGWDAAFALAGAELRVLGDPDRAAFYTSGRSSNEAAFAYQLFARAFGTNNLPDSSNLCHESSGQALTASIGVGKSTVTRADFAHAQLIMSFGHNPGSNHPRMLADLREAKKRGCRIIVFNPLRERGLEAFADPQSPGELLGGTGTQLADAYYRVRIGGDLAAITGIAKAVVERGGVDREFIDAHTDGFAAFRDLVSGQPWPDIEDASGLTRAQMEEAAGFYIASPATIAAWCMGLTQNEFAIETIQTLVNLMLLRGNVGKPGAGLMPVRGHSNVQGDRTVGITSRPKPAWLAGLQRVFGFTPPAAPGRDAIGTIDGLLDGSVQAFVALGGNFAVAAPDTPRVLDALSRTRLTVHIATKLNRTHLYPGRTGLLLPCLGRTELDVQPSGPQFVSVEDTASMVHASMGTNRPAGELLRSEPYIVSQLARHALTDSPIDWDTIGTDYDATRTLIERVADGAVDGFAGYNERIRHDKGFHLPNSAGRREWHTAVHKARFVAHALPRDTAMARARAQYGDRVLCLATIRAHRQYNTTVYRDPKGEVDRYRGVHGTRHLLFVGNGTLARLGFADGDMVRVRAASPDGIERHVDGIRLVAAGQAGDDVFGYFPELTPLLSPALVARGANTPAFKQIPVLLERAGVAVQASQG